MAGPAVLMAVGSAGGHVVLYLSAARCVCRLRVAQVEGWCRTHHCGGPAVPARRVTGMMVAGMLVLLKLWPLCPLLHLLIVHAGEPMDVPAVAFADCVLAFLRDKLRHGQGE